MTDWFSKLKFILFKAVLFFLFYFFNYFDLIKTCIMKSRVNNWDSMGSLWFDMNSYPSLPWCHHPTVSYPFFCFLVTWLCPPHTHTLSPPPLTPQSAVDVGGWVIVGPFINRCCPSHVCELSRRAPTSFAVVEPRAICWGTWWLKRSERKRGGGRVWEQGGGGGCGGK